MDDKREIVMMGTGNIKLREGEYIHVVGSNHIIHM
jgi:hypothetical protein